jgi:hypothetical protein
MQGSIRVIVGLVFVMGALGGMEHGTDPQLMLQLGLALFGLLVMASGVKAMNRE